MKITREPHIELAAGFYWAVGTDRSTFSNKIEDQRACIVQISGEYPFLKHELLGNPPCAGELHIVAQIDVPRSVTERLEKSATAV